MNQKKSKGLVATNPKGQFLVYAAKDGEVKIDVRLENETLWLTQAQIAQLFGKGRSTVTEHIQNIYAEGELEPIETSKKLSNVGNPDITTYKPPTYYNLDMIISVGYRIKSAVATRFRVWATRKLKKRRGQIHR